MKGVGIPRSLPLVAAGCRECGNVAVGVFCGVIWGVVRGMGRVSACEGRGMVVFVGFGVVDGRGN